MTQASNLKRVEAIVVRPFTGADNIVRNVGQRFFTTEGRLKKYASARNSRGRLRPLAIHCEPVNGRENQEREDMGTKSIGEAPENKAVEMYENKGVPAKPKKRGRPKGSRNKKRKKR